MTVTLAFVAMGAAAGSRRGLQVVVGGVGVGGVVGVAPAGCGPAAFLCGLNKTVGDGLGGNNMTGEFTFLLVCLFFGGGGNNMTGEGLGGK